MLKLFCLSAIILLLFLACEKESANVQFRIVSGSGSYWAMANPAGFVKESYYLVGEEDFREIRLKIPDCKKYFANLSLSSSFQNCLAKKINGADTVLLFSIEGEIKKDIFLKIEATANGQKVFGLFRVWK